MYEYLRFEKKREIIHVASAHILQINPMKSITGCKKERGEIIVKIIKDVSRISHIKLVRIVAGTDDIEIPPKECAAKRQVNNEAELFMIIRNFI